jgi:hypothetical protein
VRVQIYALGYVDTAMAVGRRCRYPRPTRRGSPEPSWRAYQERRFTYLPRYWRLITFGLRHLPWPVYRRVRF